MRMCVNSTKWENCNFVERIFMKHPSEGFILSAQVADGGDAVGRKDPFSQAQLELH